MNKVSFYVEQSLLPFLLDGNVPHQVIEKTFSMLWIEIENSGVVMMKLIAAVEAHTKAKLLTPQSIAA